MTHIPVHELGHNYFPKCIVDLLALNLRIAWIIVVWTTGETKSNASSHRKVHLEMSHKNSGQSSSTTMCFWKRIARWSRESFTARAVCAVISKPRCLKLRIIYHIKGTTRKLVQIVIHVASFVLSNFQYRWSCRISHVLCTRFPVRLPLFIHGHCAIFCRVVSLQLGNPWICANEAISKSVGKISYQ